MTSYAIVRHGSNAANQGMRNRAIVGTIEATTQKAALAAFAADRPDVQVFSNQRLEAIPYSRLSAEDRQELEEAIRCDYTVLQPLQVGCILCGRHPDAPMPAHQAESWHCGCES